MNLRSLFNYYLYSNLIFLSSAYANVIVDKVNNNELRFGNISLAENIGPEFNKKVTSFTRTIDGMQQLSCDDKIFSSVKGELKNGSRGLEDEYYMIIGYAYEKCNDNAQAIAWYKKSKQIRNKNASVAFKIAILECQNKNYIQCKNYLDEAEWQGFKPAHLVLFNRALMLSLENKVTEALPVAEKALSLNEAHVPTAKLLYFIKVELIATSKNTTLKTKIQNELHLDIGRIYMLSPTEIGYGTQYAKNLLTTGDIIKSQNKLQQGQAIVERMIADHPKHRNELYLLKIQFMEKQKKFAELDAFLINLKKQSDLSPELKAKIAMSSNEDDAES